MAPRSHPLPQAATESAREARKSFFCTLCQKGYARQPEFEAHENSYDHQHRKRLKEMRNLTKDPSAAARARAAEERTNAEAGLKSISLASATGGGGGGAGGGGGGAYPGGKKKKPVFKSTLQPQNGPGEAVAAKAADVDVNVLKGVGGDANRAIVNGWAHEAYDPAVHCPTPLMSEAEYEAAVAEKIEEWKALGQWNLEPFPPEDVLVRMAELIGWDGPVTRKDFEKLGHFNHPSH